MIEAGIDDLAKRASLISALGDSQSPMKEEPIDFLLLQGSSTYLPPWYGEKSGLPPIPLCCYLDFLNEALRDFKSRLNSQQLSKKARDEKPKAVWLELGNVIMAKLILTAQLPGAAMMVHSQRTVKCTGEDGNGEWDIPTQLWAGLLAQRHDEGATHEGSYAIAVDIGAGSTSVGYHPPVDKTTDYIKPIRVASADTKFIDHFTRLAEAMDPLVTDEDKNGSLPKAETIIRYGDVKTLRKVLGQNEAESDESKGKTDLELVNDLANELFKAMQARQKKSNKNVFELIFEDIQCTPPSERTRKTPKIRVYIVGTCLLRQRRGVIEQKHGHRTVAIVESIAQVVAQKHIRQELRGLQERHPSNEIEVDATFEILDADYEAFCEQVAMLDAIKQCHTPGYTDLKVAVQEQDRKHFKRRVGSVSWGMSGLGGNIATEAFSARMGIQTLVKFLVRNVVVTDNVFTALLNKHLEGDTDEVSYLKQRLTHEDDKRFTWICGTINPLKHPSLRAKLWPAMQKTFLHFQGGLAV